MSTTVEETSTTDDRSPKSMADVRQPLRDRLGELPATASIVYLVLRQEGEPLSSSDVADITLRSRSTIHRTMKRLRDEGIIEERTSIRPAEASKWAPIPVDDVELEAAD